MKKLTQSGLRWLWLAIIVLGVDHLTKLSALNQLYPYDPYVINPFFNLMLAFNRGAAFSFLNSASGWQTWLLGSLAAIVSIIILIKLSQVTHKDRWLCISLVLIMSGALGNLYDRITIGYVIDFIQFHISDYYWPVFNVADTAVCIGAVMLFIEITLFRKNK